MVSKAMMVLTVEQRTVIIMKEYHGLTFQEIADLVECPLSTVKTPSLSRVERAASAPGAERACKARGCPIGAAC